MFEPRENMHHLTSIAQIKETYRDHPCMLRVNALKKKLKQEKLQDKAFYQSIKQQKVVY